MHNVDQYEVKLMIDQVKRDVENKIKDLEYEIDRLRDELRHEGGRLDERIDSLQGV